MEKRNIYAMNLLKKETGKCDLCGSCIGLEVHHIIPVSLGGEDSKENEICLCKKCHALLTPTSILTKAALQNKKKENERIIEFSDVILDFSREIANILENRISKGETLSMSVPDLVMKVFEDAIKYSLDRCLKQIGQKKGKKLKTKKSVGAKEIIQKMSKDFNGDLSDVDVMKLTGLARGTYYKYKRELKTI